MRRQRLYLGVLLAVVALSSGVLAGTPTSVINYQGMLTDGGGNPISGNVDLTARIYTTDAGGVPLFAETHSSVLVTDGIFNVLLGSHTALSASVFENKPLFLGVEVGHDGEMTPRQQLAMVPYAFVAETAEAFKVPLSITEADTGTLLRIENTGTGDAVVGVSTDGGRGVRGEATGTSGETVGVFGEAVGSSSGLGVAGNGGKHGVQGASTGTTGGKAGVFGTALGASGFLPGTAAGVWGDTNTGYGVSGISKSGTGLHGYSQSGYGVLAYSGSSSAPAVLGFNDAANGVVGRHGGIFAVPDVDAGVYGSSTTGHGVYGISEDNTVAGSYGGYFEGPSPWGGGVKGVSTEGVGVYALHQDPSATNPAVYGKNEGSGDGVLGRALVGSADDWGNAGVRGQAVTGPGVIGTSTSGNGVVGYHGVEHPGQSVDNAGGYFGSISGPAVYAAGDVYADRIVYNAPRTHYYTVPSEAFLPYKNVDYVNSAGNGGAYVDAAGFQVMAAPIDLPHGATVTAFKVFFYDASASDLTVTLQRQWLTDGYYTSMASTTSSGTGGYDDDVDTSINEPVVDKLAYGYLVYAYSSNWSSSLRIKGAVITYTIDEAQ